ncbi:MAG: hypothetical protein ACLR4Z_14385 [Butyricicoccaceae bacterium]
MGTVMFNDPTAPVEALREAGNGWTHTASRAFPSCPARSRSADGGDGLHHPVTPRPRSNIYRRCHGLYDSLLTPRAYQRAPLSGEAVRKRCRSAAVYASPCSAHARPRRRSQRHTV